MCLVHIQYAFVIWGKPYHWAFDELIIQIPILVVPVKGGGGGGGGGYIDRRLALTMA